MDRRLLDYKPELEAFGSSEFERGAQLAARAVAPVFDESTEFALAAELLSLPGRAALDEFLAALVARVGAGAPQPAHTPGGRAVVRLLRRAANAALAPIRASAHGKSMQLEVLRTAQVFGIETEGMSPEDREFALARQFIRLAASTARNASLRQGNPDAVAAEALRSAAREYAPGLLALLGMVAPQAAQPARGGAQIASLSRRSGRTVPSGHFAVSPFLKEHTMHDIDRNTMEYGQEMSGFEAEQFEFGGQGEWSGEGGLLSEQQEMELANELLNVGNEQELEQFLGSLINKIGSVAGKVINSPLGRAVGGVLKGAIKKVVPLAGGALGGFFGGPLGAQIGSGLANAAGSALGLEAESLSGEDREFAGARQFVKLAADTIAKATQAGGGDPRMIAQNAALAAARQFAPGLLSRPNGAAAPQGMGQQFTGQQGTGQQGAGQQLTGQQGMGRLPAGRPGMPAPWHGRWSRQGNKIVLHGV